MPFAILVLEDVRHWQNKILKKKEFLVKFVQKPISLNLQFQWQIRDPEGLEPHSNAS